MPSFPIPKIANDSITDLRDMDDFLATFDVKYMVIYDESAFRADLHNVHETWVASNLIANATPYNKFSLLYANNASGIYSVGDNSEFFDTYDAFGAPLLQTATMAEIFSYDSKLHQILEIELYDTQENAQRVVEFETKFVSALRDNINATQTTLETLLVEEDIDDLDQHFDDIRQMGDYVEAIRHNLGYDTSDQKDRIELLHYIADLTIQTENYREAELALNELLAIDKFDIVILEKYLFVEEQLENVHLAIQARDILAQLKLQEPDIPK